ncbi:MAG: FtsX-like permease family protein [Methylophaga sp.]|nr:FtsX-like permease family protein [Methylophaga sp.]
MAAMGFACAMMIVFSSLMEGVIAGSERNVVAMNTGDIQVHQQGYRDDPDIYKMITSSEALSELIRQAGFVASERVFAFGLMASDNSSSGVQLRGVDLRYESTVTEIHQHIMTGSWLGNDAPRGVVVGKKLARLLDVSVGDELIFVGQTADGYMANDRFHVQGTLKSIASDIDSSAVLMSNEMLRELISLPEQGAHQIVIMRTDRTQDLALATEEVKVLIEQDLEVMNWRQLMPVINRFLETAQVQTLIMLLFTYIAVASIVLNAMLMNVFERIHEFGIMKAIGVKPWQIVRLVYAETLIQAAVASVAGLLLGAGISWYFQYYGLDMSPLADGMSFAGVALDPIWYAVLSVNSLLTPVAFLFVMAAVAVIYPAAKVARLRPVEAIHHQ